LQNATSKGELGDLEGPDRFEGLTTNPSLAYRAVPQKEFYIGLCWLWVIKCQHFKFLTA